MQEPSELGKGAANASGSGREGMNRGKKTLRIKSDVAKVASKSNLRVKIPVIFALESS